MTNSTHALFLRLALFGLAGAILPPITGCAPDRSSGPTAADDTPTAEQCTDDAYESNDTAEEATLAEGTPDNWFMDSDVVACPDNDDWFTYAELDCFDGYVEVDWDRSQGELELMLQGADGETATIEPDPSGRLWTWMSRVVQDQGEARARIRRVDEGSAPLSYSLSLAQEFACDE